MLNRERPMMRSLTFAPLFAAVALAFGNAGCGGTAPPPEAKTSNSKTTNSKQTPKPGREGNEHVGGPAISRDIPLTLDMLPKSEPIPIFRPDDQRKKHDDQKLADLGIERYASKRLILYTDIDPKIAITLPPVIDQAYDALVEYFGPLPPDKARTEFQMTGYLIKSDALFREAGLIPEDLPMFEHGRHRRNEFWMREQKYDYYRRHLLIHEVTHCFMTIMPDVEAPVWYIEGMAEYFGSHRLADDGTAQFRQMPTSPDEFAGMGRITIIRNEYAAGRANSVSQILDLRPEEFLKKEHYAWSWALCMFLDTHPNYQDRFREMKGYLQRNAFPTQFYRVFQPDRRDLVCEWAVFVLNLQFKYDLARASIDFLPGTKLTEQMPKAECRIAADQGWQSSEVLVEAGQSYDITASGQFELANEPKPWISEPQGISFRYFNGIPLGCLLACVHTETGDSDAELISMLTIARIGHATTYTAPFTGTLYFRVNDDWSSLADNLGEVQVEIRATTPK